MENLVNIPIRENIREGENNTVVEVPVGTWKDGELDYKGGFTFIEIMICV